MCHAQVCDSDFFWEDIMNGIVVKIWREYIFLVYGYGGDVMETITSGFRGIFDVEYAKKILRN